MSEARTETKLFLPFLQPFYDAVIPLSWLILRVAVGWNLLVHGWGKIMIGPTPGFLKAFADLGYTPPEFFFWSSFLIEMLVGVVHDPQFGPVVACGAGGTTAELMKDVAVRITPPASTGCVPAFPANRR